MISWFSILFRNGNIEMMKMSVRLFVFFTKPWNPVVMPYRPTFSMSIPISKYTANRQLFCIYRRLYLHICDCRPCGSVRDLYYWDTSMIILTKVSNKKNSCFLCSWPIWEFPPFLDTMMIRRHDCDIHLQGKGTSNCDIITLDKLLVVYGLVAICPPVTWNWNSDQ